MTQHRCRLYLITPSSFELEIFANQLEDALSGGDVACLQLRMKQAKDENIIEVAQVLLPICRKFDVQFILNDYPELAVKIGADGVHIGEEKDGSVQNARNIVGDNKIVGVSCYASKDKAYSACEDSADYVAFGQFYESTTKPPKGRPTPELLEIWSQTTTIPCVAIGGITPANASTIVKAGADFIAVVSGVWDNPKAAKAAVKAYNDVM